VGVRFEVGVDEVGELTAPAVDLDDVGPLDLAEVGPTTPLVDPEKRL
jgi:hypothetical protein